MLKWLPIFSLLMLLFVVTNAQTHADSTKNLIADSTAKTTLTDTVVKKTAPDSIDKKDTASSHVKIDAVVKKTVVNFAVDSTMNKPVIDSVAKTSVIVKTVVDSMTTKNPVESGTKGKSKAAPKTGTYSFTVKVTPPPPDKIVKHSPVKTLSDERYNAYLKGDDLDSMAIVAEMNNYPLPDQALKYKVQIGLNPGQIIKLKALATELHRKKVEMGDNIIRNEKMLDSLFHSRKIVDGTLIFYTNRSGLYYGELRGAILMACYNTEQLLSDDQLKKLDGLLKAH